MEGKKLRSSKETQLLDRHRRHVYYVTWMSKEITKGHKLEFRFHSLRRKINVIKTIKLRATFALSMYQTKQKI